MSDSPSGQLATALKEHTAIAASVVSIVLGVLSIIGYFAATADGGPSQPAVNFGEARFGTQQSPATLLPAGQTAGPGGSVRVCPPDDLYVWVTHDLPDGTALTGEWLSDGLAVSAERVVTSGTQPTVWMRLQQPSPGQYGFRAVAAGSSRSWDVKVVC